MKVRIWLYVILALGMGMPGWCWEFNTDGNLEGWTNTNQLSDWTVKDGNLILSVKANSNDPYIYSPSGSWDANTITGIEFRIRFSTDVTGKGGPAVYYFPASGGHGNYEYEILYPNEWNVIYLDFLGMSPGGDSPNAWMDEISQIRIDFPDNVTEDYTVEIDWIRFIDSPIKNNNFEFGGVEPWTLDGAGSLDAFKIYTNDSFSDYSCVAATGVGSTQYHALVQDISGGLDLLKGQTVSVVGAVKIPKASWDADSVLWFRVRESDGTNENLSPATEVTTFDEWFQFQSSVELKYDPAKRKSLTVQLESKNPSGKVFYFDDIFVDILAVGEKTIENPGWPVNAVKLGTGQQITIDGEVSASEYKNAQALVMNADTLRGIPDPYFSQYNHNGTINTDDMITNTPLTDFNATYYFMWDDDYFYAAVAAQDDNVSFVGPDPNGSDALQFVFAESPTVKPTSSMYIPTIAAQGSDGNVLGKNDFSGWLADEIMGKSTFASKVDTANSDWSIEIKIPWSAMQSFTTKVFPPQTGDVVGFTLLAIDYDNGALEWFSSNASTFPWASEGVERMYFIENPTPVSDWALY